MHFSASQWFTFGISGTALLVQMALLVILRRRKLAAAFKIFFFYMLYSLAATVILDTVYVFRPTSATYFYLYWALNGVQMLLQFGVMYEVFVNTLKPYAALIDLGKMLFTWAALFLLIAATATAFGAGNTKLAKCIAGIQQVERGILLIQCGLLLLFFLFERRLGLSWRSYNISIGIGLGVSSGLTLTFTYLREHFPLWASAVDMSDSLAATAVIIYWAICLYLPEPQKKNVLDSPAKLIFQRWNEALQATPFSSTATVAVASMDSFLPNVEKTVERVMARKMMN